MSFLCIRWSLVSIFFIVLLLSGFLLGAGDWIRKDSYQTMTISGYVPANCTLSLGQTDACPRGGYASVWRRTEDGSSVVASPFSLKMTKDLAERDLNNYPLNVTMPCMCNPSRADPYPSITCNFDDACMMDVASVNYVQKIGGVYAVAGNTLCAIGAFCLLFSLIGIILILMLFNERYGCCCRKKEVDMSYIRPQHVIGDENE